jgi:hypothetical protein
MNLAWLAHSRPGPVAAAGPDVHTECDPGKNGSASNSTKASSFVFIWVGICLTQVGALAATKSWGGTIGLRRLPSSGRTDAEQTAQNDGLSHSPGRPNLSEADSHLLFFYISSCLLT